LCKYKYYYYIKIKINIIIFKAGLKPSFQCNWNALSCSTLRNKFHYLYFVTTYLPFQREWRAICARFRLPYSTKLYNFNLLLSPISTYISNKYPKINICNPLPLIYKLHFDLTWLILIIKFITSRYKLMTAVHILRLQK